MSIPCKTETSLYPLTPTGSPIKWKTIFPASERVQSIQEQVLDALAGTGGRLGGGEAGMGERLKGGG